MSSDTPSIPVPDDSLADLTDEEQAALIERTDNGLSPTDATYPQPEAS